MRIVCGDPVRRDAVKLRDGLVARVDDLLDPYLRSARKAILAELLLDIYVTDRFSARLVVEAARRLRENL